MCAKFRQANESIFQKNWLKFWLIHDPFVSHSCIWMAHSHIPDLIYSYVRHDSSICAELLICPWDRTHLRVRYDLFICETWRNRVNEIFRDWLIHMRGITHSVRQHSSTCASWLIRMWDMKYSCKSDFNRLVHMCGRTHSFRETALIYACELTHSYVRHEAFVWIRFSGTDLFVGITHSFVRQHSSIYVCKLTYSYVRHQAFVWIGFSGTDLFICAELLIPWGSTHLRVRFDLLICETSSIRVNRIFRD